MIVCLAWMKPYEYSGLIPTSFSSFPSNCSYYSSCSNINDAPTLLQALIALKKGAQLLKYGRKGKPKFCPFKLSIVSVTNKSINVVHCKLLKDNSHDNIFTDATVIERDPGKKAPYK